MQPNRFVSWQAGALGVTLLLAACSGSVGDANQGGAAGLASTGVGGSIAASGAASAAGGKSDGQAGAATVTAGSALAGPAQDDGSVSNDGFCT